MNAMLSPMLVFFNRLRFIFISLFFVTPAMAEAPLTYAVQAPPINEQAIAALHASSGMQWQLLPGEDVKQIARLMFPSNATIREKFIQAVIHLNPELFPSGYYQPLAAGTMVHIPDLKTIHAFSAPAFKKRPRAVSDNPSPAQPQHSSAAPAAATPDLKNHERLLQLTTQLEQLSEHQAQELNSLLHHTETLALQVADMQTAQTARIQELHTQDSIARQLPENIQPTPPIQPPEQPIDQPSPDLTIITPTTEDLLSMDTLLILGALLIVLVLIIVLRGYRKVQQRMTHTGTTPVMPDISHRQGYETLFRKQDPQKIAAAENFHIDSASSDAANEARQMIKQGHSEQAVLFLQKQLSVNAFDISGWLLLFELLYSQKNKSDFKKNARRFKRLGTFPDIWLQIQDLGYRLEANEPLYFDEQKRQQRFFPDSLNSGLSS